MNIHEKDANKPLEIDEPNKEKDKKITQPTFKDELPKEWHFKKAHPQDLIISDTSNGVTTRSYFKSLANVAFISQIEPKNIDDALCDEFWVLDM